MEMEEERKDNKNYVCLMSGVFSTHNWTLHMSQVFTFGWLRYRQDGKVSSAC